MQQNTSENHINPSLRCLSVLLPDTQGQMRQGDVNYRGFLLFCLVIVWFFTFLPERLSAPRGYCVHVDEWKIDGGAIGAVCVCRRWGVSESLGWKKKVQYYLSPSAWCLAVSGSCLHAVHRTLGAASSLCASVRNLNAYSSVCAWEAVCTCMTTSLFIFLWNGRGYCRSQPNQP